MDADKIKDFFIQHVEKMVLVVVIMGSLFLIYQGMQMPNILNEHQPDALAQQATQVKAAIDEDHNENLIPERIPTFDIVKQTEELYTPIESSTYKWERTWEGKAPESIVRRQDPVLVAPRALQMTPVVTAIAVRSGSTAPDPQYPLALLEEADPVEKVEPKRRPRSRSRRGRGGEMGEMGEMGGMMGEMGEMGEMGGMMGEMGEMEGMGDMGEMEGMGAGMAGSGRTLSRDADFGFRPTQTDDKQQPVPDIGWFITGTAVVPHKELYAAYDMALKDANGYNPQRDVPYYYGFEVQRADVTGKSVDQLVDADWTDVYSYEWYIKLAALKWSGFAQEIVPEDYRDDTLTMWIPPVLLDDYRPYVTHPLIPKLSKSELKRQEAQEQSVEEVEVFEELDDDTFEVVAPGARGGIGEFQEMDMAEMGEMEGMGEMGDMEGAMGVMMGMSRGVEVDPVDYKLVRFYDMAGFQKSAKPGREYVYRVRYSVVDPNFPFSQTLQPRMNTLAPEVAERVQDLMKQATAANSRKGLFRRWSEWSDPSEPVSLPSREQHFIGPVERGSVNTFTVAGQPVEYARDAPKAKVLASEFDIQLATRVPLEIEVTEGSVLGGSKESTDVVDPITLEVKKLPNPEIVSEISVIDIDGGVPLKIADELTQPGMMLLFDSTGQLKVTDQVEDQEVYRIYTYADEKGIE